MFSHALFGPDPFHFIHLITRLQILRCSKATPNSRQKFKKAYPVSDHNGQHKFVSVFTNQQQISKCLNTARIYLVLLCRWLPHQSHFSLIVLDECSVRAQFLCLVVRLLALFPVFLAPFCRDINRCLCWDEEASVVCRRKLTNRF